MPKKIVRSKPKRAPRPTRARPVLVMVHGGGSFPEDWYKPLVAAVEKELGKPFAYLPVYYADVVKPVGVRALETPEEAQFKKDFERELEKSFDAARASPTLPADRAVGIVGLPAPLERIGGIAQELAGYFFDANLRAKIQARLIKQLDAAKKQSNRIIVASLSLGTVVCFDVLKPHADRYHIALVVHDRLADRQVARRPAL
ncbi:MAG: hypothetical protein FJ009_02990 [Chloroflexi bacterium]|nr:hypothetical protein [Chloroflexota bacterium]